MTTKVPHEITLIAYCVEADGMSIADIVETSRRHAPIFVRAFIRNPDISHIAAIAPGASLASAAPRALEHAP